VSFSLGNLTEALTLCDRLADALHDDPAYARDIFSIGAHEWALARRAAWVLPAMGRIAEGFSELGRALELARQKGETEVGGWIHSNYGLLAEWADHPSTALRHAQQGLEIAEKQGSPLSLVLAFASLGIAEHAVGDAEEAEKLLKHSIEMARDQKVLLNWEPLYVARLSGAHRSAGHPDRAIETALEAIESARRIGTRIWECEGELSLVRALLDSGGAAERNRIEVALSRVEELIQETGARSLLPFLHEARAELAALDRDEAARDRELLEAHRHFTEMGARRQAERLAKELGL
jgi:tetratricopeptide (TPR) repeat protein